MNLLTHLFRGCLFLAAVALLPLGGSAEAQNELQRTITMDYQLPNGLSIHEFTLDNGLRAVVMPNHFAPVLTYKTVFQVGSKDEKTGKRGIAHLFEHMMFRETKKLKNGEFDLRVTQMGGTQLNAYTSTDRTVYYQSIPNQFLDEIADLESERMVNLLITQEKLEAERGAVLSEYYMYLNNPGAYFFKSLNEQLYEKHPYKFDVIGTEEEIKSFTVEDCLQFYRHFYSPHNGVILVVGDVTPEKAHATINKYYGHLKPLSVKRAEIPPEPVQKKQIVSHVKHPYASQVEMGMAFKILDFDESELPYFLLLQELLGNEVFSLAYQKIVQKGLGTSVHGYFDLNPVNQPKAFYLMVTLTPGTSTEKVRLVALDLLKQLTAKPLSEKKIQMAANQVKLHYFATSNDELANMIVDGISYNGDPSYAFKFFYETFLKMKFSPKKLLQIARKYFVPGKMSFLFLSPGPSQELSQISQEKVQPTL